MGATRKVVLFVVEGPSDEAALGGLLGRVFDSNVIKFDVVHGDLFTSCRSPEKIRDHVRSEIVKHLSSGNRGYKWMDICRIVLLCDSDGVFVPDDCIFLSENGKLQYGLNSITAKDPDNIAKRNERKRKALRKLVAVDGITYRKRTIPLQVLYLSRNLEHALSDRIDFCTDGEKKLLAHRFALKYKNDIDGFKRFLEEEIGVPGNYHETWDYLAVGTHSLERCSNLSLVFKHSIES